ncbi:hypothetical protein [Patulibacter minatonensis]|uniref:hypothetical protein n=1 Tax=Patulibacter minatonensis TaxID=298163 RepID=UPI00047BDB3A|nr:hypothetical protein [Patulibacter minatonensis]
MLISARRHAPRAAALICSSLALGLAGLAAAPGARAAQNSFAYSLGQNVQKTHPERHSLYSASAYTSRGTAVSAAASTYSNTGAPLYANWDYGYGYACHYYSGANLLYPVIRNNASTTTILGTSTWGSGAAGC